MPILPNQLVASWSLVALLATPVAAQIPDSSARRDSVDDPIRTLVGRLDLDRYKATIKE
jgi:hypothetical protein